MLFAKQTFNSKFIEGCYLFGEKAVTLSVVLRRSSRLSETRVTIAACLLSAFDRFVGIRRPQRTADDDRDCDHSIFGNKNS